MSNVWVPDDAEGWIQATPDGEGSLTLKKTSGESITVTQAERDKFEDVLPGHIAGYGQIIKMSAVCDAAVLETMRVRYIDGKSYTYVDQIIIACNPFQSQGMETAENMVGSYCGKYLFLAIGNHLPFFVV